MAVWLRASSCQLRRMFINRKVLKSPRRPFEMKFVFYRCIPSSFNYNGSPSQYVGGGDDLVRRKSDGKQHGMAVAGALSGGVMDWTEE